MHTIDGFYNQVLHLKRNKNYKYRFWIFGRTLFIFGGNIINKSDDVRKKRDYFETIFLQELTVSETMFGDKYKSFKEGLKLKEFRSCPKKEFSEKLGLSLYKITQIEDYGFRSKKAELDQYWKGLKIQDLIEH